MTSTITSRFLASQRRLKVQISPNVYFKVEVLDLPQPIQQPIITQNNMGSFHMIEPAGASLPYIVFSFFTTDENLIGFFSPINKIKVTVGNSQNDSSSFTFRPLEPQRTSETSERGWEVVVGGFLGDGAYMTAKETSLYVGNSLEVLQQIMKSSFDGMKPEVDTNIDEVQEGPTRWIRTNETFCSFVMDTALHMNISPSFPLVCVDKFGQLHINDCMKMLKKPKWTFVPHTPSGIYEIQYLNNFNVDSHRPLYDLYSGFSKVTQISDISSGDIRYQISESKPVIASTKMTETVSKGPRNKTNKLKSDNVHDTYHEIFQYNTNKLMALSAQLGSLRLLGYHKELKSTDVIDLKLPKTEGKELSNLEGYYIIDSIQTTFDFRPGKPRVIITNVFVTRDNPNNVENYAPKGPNLMTLSRKAIQDLCDAVAQCRVALAMSARVMDGTFIRYCTNFLTETKNNLLRAFAVGGVKIDFNSQALFIQSMLCVSNTIMNSLMNMLLPDFIATTLRDFLIEKPSARRLLSKYIDQYVPYELQNIISALTDSLLKTHDALNSIAKANNITARSIPKVPTETVPETLDEPINIVGEIIKEFEVHTRGVDLPFPVVTLTESQKLLSRDEIKDYIADKTIENLTELGYMDGISDSEFKEVLLSEDPEETLSFATTAKINQNAGNTFMYRYWGTYGPTNETLFAWSSGVSTVYTKTSSITKNTRLYNSDYSPYTEQDFKVMEVNESYEVTYKGTVTTRNEIEDVNTTALAQLTSYYISKGFKDRYRTLPCTKVINATKNSRLYFVCPQTEKNIKFYINSKRVMLESFPIDLGYIDMYGNKILYNVYYTTTGYNSNSTTLEVRQG